MADQTMMVQLRRNTTSTPWGFRMQGGNESGSVLFIQKVNPRSVSQRYGMRVGDRILAICGAPAHHMTHEQAKMEIIRSGNELDILVQRNAVICGSDQPDGARIQRRPERSSSMEESSEYRAYTNPNVQSRSFKILQESLNYSDAHEEGMVLPEPKTPGERLVTRSVNEGKKWKEELMELHPRNFSSTSQSPYRYDSPQVEEEDQTRFVGSESQRSVASSKVYDGLQSAPREVPKPQALDVVDGHVFQPNRAFEVQQEPPVNYHEKERKHSLKNVNYNFPTEPRRDRSYQDMESPREAPQQWSAPQLQYAEPPRQPPQQWTPPQTQYVEPPRQTPQQWTPSQTQYVQPPKQTPQQWSAPQPQRPVSHKAEPPQRICLSNKIISATHEAVMQLDKLHEPQRPVPENADHAVHHVETPARPPVEQPVSEPKSHQPVIQHVQPPQQQPQQSAPTPAKAIVHEFKPPEPSPQISAPRPAVQDAEPVESSSQTSQQVPSNEAEKKPEPETDVVKDEPKHAPEPVVVNDEPKHDPEPVEVKAESKPEPVPEPAETNVPPTDNNHEVVDSISTNDTDQKYSVSMATTVDSKTEESENVDVTVESSTDVKSGEIEQVKVSTEEIAISEEAPSDVVDAKAELSEVTQVKTETETTEVDVPHESETSKSQTIVIGSDAAEEPSETVAISEIVSDSQSETHSETFHFSTSIDMDGEITEGIQITTSSDDIEAETHTFEINTDVSTDTAVDEHETTVMIGSFSIDEGDEAVDITADSSDATFSIACV